MLKLYNTLTRQVSEIRPPKSDLVKMYTCGPTVYRDVHVGNLRSFLFADCIRRVLEAQGISVKHVKNITDVGHMRQHIVDQQQDKVIEAAMAEGKSPEELSVFYTNRFYEQELKLNILPADHFPKASEHIQNIIEMVEILIERGYAYSIDGNVYYSVNQFSKYGQLSGNISSENLEQAVRIEVDPLKRDPRDFALWKTAEVGRTLKWDSPWGQGFPGWHIECSAMSMKYFGDKFDIHTGGVDNIFPHHEAEIAQYEGFVGDEVVSHWAHGQHLLADGAKMSKSLGNSFTLSDIESHGIDPLAFRYLCLTARFKSRLNFDFESLLAAERALFRLRNRVSGWIRKSCNELSEVDEITQGQWKSRFMGCLNNNLDTPGALSVAWKLVHTEISSKTKLNLFVIFDEILGLGLFDYFKSLVPTVKMNAQLAQRNNYRSDATKSKANMLSGRKRFNTKNDDFINKLYSCADVLRDSFDATGFMVEDTKEESRLRPKFPWEYSSEHPRQISNGKGMKSLLRSPDKFEYTVGIVSGDYVDDISRCIQSLLKWSKGLNIQVLVLDNGCWATSGRLLDNLACANESLSVIHADHKLGEAMAKNILINQSQGGTILMLDSCVEIVGDIFRPIDALLKNEKIGMVGPYGLRTEDFHHFHEYENGAMAAVDAVQAYCFAFKRKNVVEVGLMRESFRFYRNLDIDYSFQFKDRGFQVCVDLTLPVVRHEHRIWSELGANEREELSLNNFRRVIKKWGNRTDLLVSNN